MYIINTVYINARDCQWCRLNLSVDDLKSGHIKASHPFRECPKMSNIPIYEKASEQKSKLSLDKKYEILR